MSCEYMQPVSYSCKISQTLLLDLWCIIPGLISYTTTQYINREQVHVAYACIWSFSISDVKTTEVCECIYNIRRVLITNCCTMTLFIIVVIIINVNFQSFVIPVTLLSLLGFDNLNVYRKLNYN